MVSSRKNAYMLVAPLIAFLIVLFVSPIASIIHRAVYMPEVAEGFPALAHYFTECESYDGACSRPYAPLLEDLENPENRAALAVAARRLNYQIPDFRSLIMNTARELRRNTHDDLYILPGQVLRDIDDRWADDSYWFTLRRSIGSYSPDMLLAALDLYIAEDGGLSFVPENRRIFLNIMERTALISFGVTITTVLLGYLFAGAIATVRSTAFRTACLFAVMIPFWTSLLVRTSAWIVVLQREGVINSFLMSSNLISSPLALMFNRVGIFVVMVHVLLPFAVLPIYSVMRGISPSYMRAAASLGGNAFQSFLKVYLPLTMPGVIAAGTITFIVALGYYITPALVGGPGDQMIGYFIAYYTNVELNVGMSAALAVILLAIVLLLLGSLGKAVGVRNIMSGYN